MNGRFIRRAFPCLFVLIVGLILPVKSAHAVLGDGRRSVDLDHQKLPGKRMNLLRAGYSIEIIESPGLTIREYLAPDGTIFAVSWSGNRFPDLVTLFGAYYTEYQQAKDNDRQRKRFFHGPLRLASSRLVVETGGRSPHLRGRAYVPALLPSGVAARDIE